MALDKFQKPFLILKTNYYMLT